MRVNIENEKKIGEDVLIMRKIGEEARVLLGKGIGCHLKKNDC